MITSIPFRYCFTVYSDSQLDEEPRLNFPSPKSQSLKKDPPPTARRPVLNTAASPHANQLARPPRFPEIFEEGEGARCTRRRPLPKLDSRHLPQEAALYDVFRAHPRAGTPIVSHSATPTESLLKQGKKRISRQQSPLMTVGSGNSSSGSTTSSSAKSRVTSPPPRAPSPAFGLPLRRNAGLAEEDYTAVHGHRRVDADEDVELERASNRGKKKRTLAQAQAEEAPAEEGGREREKRRIREDFDVAAQRLQDVTNVFVTRASLPPLDTNIFEQDRRTPPEDTDSDMPSSALTYASTRPPLRQHLLTSPHRAIRVRRQYPFQVRTPMHRRWAENGVYARAPTIPSQSSTPRCANRIPRRK
ncbi:hypothetical protein EI94DRAFT_368096 [Lactarius quietus]|nr:hypothetical protein EI94DRAFT_368096 [Lactarius quietus]